MIAGDEIGNPVGKTEPLPPNPALLTRPGEVSGNPPTEDHIFGDVFGTIRGGLMLVFGETKEFEERMRAYDPRLMRCWSNIKDLDLGHKTGDMAITVGRENNKYEVDQQDYRFGIYSRRFQWQLCRCVLTNGYITSSEKRQIQRPSRHWGHWVSAVLNSLNDLKNSLVDECALKFYLANPREDHPTRNLSSVTWTHSALSLSDVPRYLAEDRHSEKIRGVLRNYDQVSQTVGKLLQIIGSSAPKTYRPTYDSQTNTTHHVWW